MIPSINSSVTLGEPSFSLATPISAAQQASSDVSSRELYEKKKYDRPKWPALKNKRIVLSSARLPTIAESVTTLSTTATLNAFTMASKELTMFGAATSIANQNPSEAASTTSVSTTTSNALTMFSAAPSTAKNPSLESVSKIAIDTFTDESTLLSGSNNPNEQLKISLPEFTAPPIAIETSNYSFLNNASTNTNAFAALNSFEGSFAGIGTTPLDAAEVPLPAFDSFASMDSLKAPSPSSSDPVQSSAIKGFKEAPENKAKRLIASDKSQLQEETVEYQLKAMHNQFVAMMTADYEKDFAEFLRDFHEVIDYLVNEAIKNPQLIENLIVMLSSKDSSIKPYINATAKPEFRNIVERFWAYLIGATDMLKKEIENLEKRADIFRAENMISQPEYEAKLKEISQHKIGRLEEIREMLCAIRESLSLELQSRKKYELTITEISDLTFEDESIPDADVPEESKKKRRCR